MSKRDPAVVAVVEKADELEDQGDLEGAIEVLTTAIAEMPTAPWLRARRGLLYKARAQWSEAIAEFDAALAQKPDAASTLYTRGQCLARVGRFDDAIDDFEECIRLQPRSADAYWQIGVIHLFRDNLEGVVAAYKKAFELEPGEYPGLAQEIAELERRVGDRSIRQVFDDHDAGDEHIVAARKGSYLLEREGDLDGALAVLTSAIEKRPGVPLLFALRGRVQKLREQWAEAVADFDAALALRPDAPSTVFLRARCLVQTGTLDEALRDFAECIRLEPEAADAYWESGTILDQRGHRKAALVAYRKASELDPERYPFPGSLN